MKKGRGRKGKRRKCHGMKMKSGRGKCGKIEEAKRKQGVKELAEKVEWGRNLWERRRKKRNGERKVKRKKRNVMGDQYELGSKVLEKMRRVKEVKEGRKEMQKERGGNVMGGK